VRTKILVILAITLPLILALFLMLRYVNLPYVGPNATDANKLSLISRNYNYWGLLNTKFTPIIDVSVNIAKHPTLYFNHGVLMLVLQSFFFRVFGYDFWVGRISYILGAFLCLPLLFLIGKEIRDKTFGIIALIVGSLIPATVVFGRIPHYQGSWTVFFIILVGYLCLKYVKSKNKMFFYAALISAVLGTLCDWPMTYFTLFLLPLFCKNRKTKQGIILILSSTITASLLLFYINLFEPLIRNLLPAIANRSLGNLLTSLSFWPIRWVSVLLIRFVLYFNPFFALFSAVYIFYFIKKLKNKKLKDFDLLIFSFFAYSMTYIVLYPEGSFGHPFWMYGFVPFVALAASEIIQKNLLNSKFLLVAIIIFSIVFTLRIEDWKTQQNVSQSYRYNLAKSVSSNFVRYDTLDVNPDSYINSDLFMYAFYQNARPVPLPLKSTKDLKNANYYVYSCIGCSLNNPEVNSLAQNFKYKTYDSSPGRVYIFFLKQKQDQMIPLPIVAATPKAPLVKVVVKESFLRKAYTFLIGFLSAPQI
jgi:hypothetical protein